MSVGAPRISIVPLKVLITLLGDFDVQPHRAGFTDV